jgi:hypothetical protein
LVSEVSYSATSAPTLAETVRDVAREVIARPEFQVDEPSTLPYDILDAILRFLAKIFKPFQEFAEYLYEASPFLFWLVVVGLVLIAAALIAHIVYSFRVALARRAETISGLTKSKRVLDPNKLEADAKAAAMRGDFIGAVRLIFRACLARLEAAEERTWRLGLTNRELLSRYRNTQMAEALRTLVETIDAKWYGHALCDAADYEACVQAQNSVKRHVGEIVARQAAAAAALAKKQSGGTPHALRS